MTENRLIALRRFTSVALIAGMLAPVPSLLADEKTVRCESSAGRHRECRVDTDGQVRLERELSLGRCHMWRTWGYDKERIWVDNGCRAEFRVGKDGGLSTGGAIAIGAGIAGGAALVAILATRDKDKGTEASAPPSWAVGRFSGFNPKFNLQCEIEVTSAGAVSGTANGQSLSGHTTKGDHIAVGNADFKLQKESWGFSASDKSDSASVFYFRRQ
jgi:hypothetical protein